MNAAWRPRIWLVWLLLKNRLDVVMRSLVLCVFALAMVGCESASEDIPAKTPLFVTDDCALLFVIGREHCTLGRNDAAVAVRLNGEDAPWDPGCNWSLAGFNAVQVRGPEGDAATRSLDKITFNRPRYDTLGALVRTGATRSGVVSGALCRIVRSGSVWMLEACGPDPKLTDPRPAAPSPSDQTPEVRPGFPPAIPGDGARAGGIPERDPGQTRPGDLQ